MLNIYVKVAFSHDYREITSDNSFFGKAVSKGIFKIDTWSSDFCDELDFNPKTDAVVVKHRINPLYGTNLEVYLQSRKINNVILTGVATDLAVQILARDLIDRDLSVIVASDACATFCDETHEASLISLARMSKVVTNKELLSLGVDLLK